MTTEDRKLKSARFKVMKKMLNNEKKANKLLQSQVIELSNKLKNAYRIKSFN